MAGARNSGGWSEAGTSSELALINLNVHFFSLSESSLFCIE